MSFKCESHGWRHMLKTCPSCPPPSLDSLEVQKLKKHIQILEEQNENLDKENNQLMYLMAQLANEDKKKIDRLQKTVAAIDWHIRTLQNEKVLSMSEMIRALKVISDIYWTEEMKQQTNEQLIKKIEELEKEVARWTNGDR